jgi:SNF2-related domain
MLDPRWYQDEAVDAALKHDGFGLFLEQRTGKTPIACRIVERRQPDVLLVACPKGAIDTWESHLAQYDIHAETQIMTLESVATKRNRRRLKRWLQKARTAMIIVDESHRIKDRRSKVSRSLRSLAQFANWRLALTGTPLEGKIWDAWAQYDFIDPGVFGPWKDFKSRYLIYGGYMGFKIIGTRNPAKFQSKFHSRFFRVLLEDVKPEKTDIAPPHKVEFELVASSPMYNQMHSKFMVELDRMGTYRRVRELDPETGEFKFVRRRRRVIAPRVITQAMKLHQISGGFVLDEQHRVHHFGDEKLEQCGALLCALGDVPTVIIVRFLPELYRIAALARALGRQVTLISGSHKWIPGTPFDVAVVQIRSGISIDLSRAEELIFYSWNYSYLDYDQAKFRIRSFMSKRARYHYLVARDTIDEQLYQVVTKKLSFTTLIMNQYRRK